MKLPSSSFRVALIGLCSVALLAPVARSAVPTTWKAGAASVVITPEKFIWMAGYGARTKPAEGKTQDLHAKALALEDSAGTRLVFVTTDLVGISRELRAGVEQKVRAAYRLPREALLINASHTHSGPELRGSRARPERAVEAQEYAAKLEEKIVRIIGEALTNLAPADVTWNEARAGFAMNRRLPTAKGVVNRPYPDGPVDHQVPALRIQSPEGELRAVLFGYACHNTTLSGYNWNGDYAGYAQEYLQANRPGVIALFLMGCGGDQNPYPRRLGEGGPGLNEIDFAQHHGRALANAVEVALRVPPRPVTGPLLMAYDHVTLDYADGRPSQNYPVQVVKFGPSLTLVALTSEVVIDYALRLKRELAGDKGVWIAAYSNDSMGYIPSLRVQREGGYETGAGWAESTEERIIAKVHQLHGQLRAPTSAAGPAATNQ